MKNMRRGGGNFTLLMGKGQEGGVSYLRHTFLITHMHIDYRVLHFRSYYFFKNLGFRF